MPRSSVSAAFTPPSTAAEATPDEDTEDEEPPTPPGVDAIDQYLEREMPTYMGYQMDKSMPLHQLAEQRIRRGRDLKIIITAKDSQTGVGKTTLAVWLALTWTKYFTDREWFVDRENYGEGLATLNPREYFSIVSKIPDEYPAGSVVIVDDAEELDARRSMQSLNVEFSQRWMLMRLKQAITIITLPSPKAIDSRLEELADVWINIDIRGRGIVHSNKMVSYGSRSLLNEQKHTLLFPDVGNHDAANTLRRMKEDKMDVWDSEEEEEQANRDPDKVERETERSTKAEVAQRMRDRGMPIESQDPDTDDIVSAINMSQSWVTKNTTAPE